MKGFVEFWGNAVYRHTVSWRVPRSAPGQLGSSEGWGGGAVGLPAADHRGDTQRGLQPRGAWLACAGAAAGSTSAVGGGGGGEQQLCSLNPPTFL